MKKSILIYSAILLLSGCKYNSDIPPCNPQEGKFIKGEHYVSSDLINEDKHWDYLSLEKHNQKKSKYYPDQECIPIDIPKNTVDKIDQIIEDIDYNH